MSEDLNKIKNDLFELKIQAEGLASLGSAISDAMENSPNTVDTYAPGVWLFSNLLFDFKNKLCAIKFPQETVNVPIAPPIKNKTAPAAATVETAHK